MVAPDPVTGNAIVERILERVRRVLDSRGASLDVRLEATGDLGAAHLEEPVHVVLLVLAEHVRPGGTFTLTVRDREGGDAELLVDGLEVPEDFPATARHRDLWDLAANLLVSYHRSRIAGDPDRVLILVPHGDRAARLRGGAGD